MKEFKEAKFYKPTPRQKDFAGKLAREIRDRLHHMTGDAPSAHSLAKYYEIDDLKEALAELKSGNQVAFE